MMYEIIHELKAGRIENSSQRAYESGWVGRITLPLPLFIATPP